MDTATAIGSLFAAFGLSGAAGLNAWLPVFASALLARIGAVDLAAPFGELQSDAGLIALGAFTVADFVGDKVPAVDHVLHGAGAVVAPVSGAILFLGQTGLETDLPDLAAVVIGALVAGSVHAERATVRSGSTLGTAGTANPLLSFGEDAASAVLVVVAFVLPVLAFLAVVGLLVGGFFVARRVGRALRR
jgi:Domain of unknown function (DUF4126)